MIWKDCIRRQRILSICMEIIAWKMKSLWRHTGSCLGYCLRKDTYECLWHLKIKTLCPVQGSYIGLFSVFHFLVIVHGKHYLWICSFPETDHFSYFFASGLDDTFCYLRMFVVNIPDHSFGLLCSNKHWFPFTITIKWKQNVNGFHSFLSTPQQTRIKTQAGAEQLKTCRVTNENGNCEACTTWECCQLLTKGFTARFWEKPLTHLLWNASGISGTELFGQL